MLHLINPVLTNVVTETDEVAPTTNVPVNRYDIKYIRAFCRGRWGDDWFEPKSEKYNRKKLAVAAFATALPNVDSTAEAENLGGTYDKGD